MSLFKSCFQDPSSGSSSQKSLLRGKDKSQSTTEDSCPFCNIPPAGTPSSTFKIVLESEKYIAFHDRSPKASVHLLTVPREHIGTCKDLRGAQGAQIVEEMKSFGEKALDILSSPTASIPSDTTLVPGRQSTQKRRYGFHIPPFNSINHLHLHCLQEPFTLLGRLKYPISSGSPNAKPPTIKGWSWFVTAEQAVQLCEANRVIRVGAQSKYSVVGQDGARQMGGVSQYR
ncbi:unnamed protein product [Sympodiomycopsis kandeliae]